GKGRALLLEQFHPLEGEQDRKNSETQPFRRPPVIPQVLIAHIEGTVQWASVVVLQRPLRYPCDSKLVTAQDLARQARRPELSCDHDVNRGEGLQYVPQSG